MPTRKSSRSRTAPKSSPKTTPTVTVLGKKARTPRIFSGIQGLKDTDVLFGRGSNTVMFPGNVRFRHIVWKYKAAYVSTERKHRAKYVNMVINEVRTSTPPARFVEVTDSGFELAGLRRIHEKVCQSLREKKNKRPKNFQGEIVEPDPSTIKSVVKTKTAIRPKSARASHDKEDIEASAEEFIFDDSTETLLSTGTKSRPKAVKPRQTAIEAIKTKKRKVEKVVEATSVALSRVPARKRIKKSRPVASHPVESSVEKKSPARSSADTQHPDKYSRVKARAIPKPVAQPELVLITEHTKMPPASETKRVTVPSAPKQSLKKKNQVCKEPLPPLEVSVSTQKFVKSVLGEPTKDVPCMSFGDDKEDEDWLDSAPHLAFQTSAPYLAFQTSFLRGLSADLFGSAPAQPTGTVGHRIAVEEANRAALMFDRQLSLGRADSLAAMLNWNVHPSALTEALPPAGLFRKPSGPMGWFPGTKIQARKSTADLIQDADVEPLAMDGHHGVFDLAGHAQELDRLFGNEEKMNQVRPMPVTPEPITGSVQRAQADYRAKSFAV